MKVNLLKKIIKEAVREAFKDEIKDSLYQLYLLEDKAKNTGNIQKEVEVPVHTQEENKYTDNQSINNLLNETKNSLTKEDLRHMFNSYQGIDNSSYSPAGDEGLDISNLDFVKTASKIYKASKQD